MKNKIALQVIFWLFVLAINLALASRFDDFDDEMVIEVVNVVFYAAVFYLNVTVIFPRYYVLRKSTYIVASLFILVFSSIALFNLNKLLFDLLRDHHWNRGWGISTFIQPLWLIMIYLAGTVFSIQHLLNQQIKRNKEIIEEKLQTELQLLKNQINPHFLFNALNNVYSLTYTKSEKAPESILKLSDMLRYVIEECNKEQVTISSEINYLINLIDFYKMKSPDKRSIKFSYDIENPDLTIAPMLFIPFIENSFKFSRIEEDKLGFIEIVLKEASSNIYFAIRNSIFQKRVILQGSQQGISNVKQRLEIIYPQRHTLKIEKDNKTYSVELTVDLT